MKKIREGYKMTELGGIPNEWEIKRIGDITDIKTGGTPSTENEEYWVDGDIPWMVSGDINKKIIYKVDRTITKLGMEKSPAKLLPVKTVMIALNGQGKTKGTVAYLETEVTCNQSLAGFIPNENYYSKYLYYNLQNRYLEIRSLAGDGARNGLNLGILRDILIPLPSIQEQQKISLILTSVDEQIEITDNLIEKTKELKKGLMQKLLTKGIEHSRFKDTEIGKIPEEWEVDKLERHVDIRSGNSPSSFELMEEGEYPFYKVDDMNYTEKYLSNSKVWFDETSFQLMPKGMVVFPKRGASIFTNKVAILDREGFFDTNVMGLICKNDILNEYLFYQLKFIELKKFADTTAVPQINNKHINPLIIPIPKLEEQLQIVSILSSVDEQIEEYESKKEKLQELKKGLMQKLLTGSIRVKV